MATFSIWESEVFDNTGITGNGVWHLATSTEQPNATGLNSIRVVCEYESVTPASNDREFDLTCIVESSNGETGAAQKWFPIAYQFDPFRRDIKGKTRELILQPSIVVIDMGVDDGIQLGGDTVARISRQQGKLGDDFRVCIVLHEQDYGGPGAFQSATISVYGERFNES